MSTVHSSRPTIHDVAREASVSLATVDRVLNQRPGVRAMTIERVERAIRKLGYVRDIHAANLAKSRSYRLLFIIPQGHNSFMRDLEAQVLQLQPQLQAERIRIELLTVPPFDAGALEQALDKVDEGITAIAMVATESPRVSAAVERLAERGIPLVTLVSDLPGSRRIHYVGINNVAAGRTAASLLGRFLWGRQGKVVCIAGSMLLRDHVERHLGFNQVMQSEFPDLELLPVLQGRDDADTVEQLLLACLQQYPDVVGIYSLGAGNRGLIRALQQRAQAGQIRVVVHDLTAPVRHALQMGLFDIALHQDAGHEVRSAVRVLRACLDGQPLIDAQERIRIDIYTRDNLP